MATSSAVNPSNVASSQDPKLSNQTGLPEDKKTTFFGGTFESHNPEYTLDDILQCDLVGILFSASGCPPCKTFLPILQDFYKEVNWDSQQQENSKQLESKGEGEPTNYKPFEIFFASFDQSEEKFREYFAQMPWKAFSFNDERCQKFKNLYGITGVPRLVVLTADGILVTKDGRKDIVEKGENAWNEWKKMKEVAIENHKKNPPPVQASTLPSTTPLKNSSMADSRLRMTANPTDK